MFPNCNFRPKFRVCHTPSLSVAVTISKLVPTGVFSLMSSARYSPCVKRGSNSLRDTETLTVAWAFWIVTSNCLRAWTVNWKKPIHTIIQIHCTIKYFNVSLGMSIFGTFSDLATLCCNEKHTHMLSVLNFSFVKKQKLHIKYSTVIIQRIVTDTTEIIYMYLTDRAISGTKLNLGDIIYCVKI